MKTRLFTLLIVLTSALTINARSAKVLTKTEHTTLGSTKECILFDQDYSRPLKKVVYTYDAEGYLQQKVTYTYNAKRIAEEVQKMTCSYDENNNPESFILTSWDKATSTWSGKALEMAYFYSKDGKVITQISDKADYMIERELLTDK